jgi:hypothetical protein
MCTPSGSGGSSAKASFLVDLRLAGTGLPTGSHRRRDAPDLRLAVVVVVSQAHLASTTLHTRVLSDMHHLATGGGEEGDRPPPLEARTPDPFDPSAMVSGSIFRPLSVGATGRG